MMRPNLPAQIRGSNRAVYYPHIELIEGANDLRDGEVFPPDYYEPLRQLWNDNGVQQAWERGNEAALPEKYAFSFFLVF